MIPISHTTAEQAALLVAETFADDPFYRWMTPEPQFRVAALNAYFSVKVADAMGRGEAFVSESGGTVMLAERLGDASGSASGDNDAGARGCRRARVSAVIQPANLPFYRRLGFHPEAEVIRLPHDAGALTPMSRSARLAR